MGIKQLDLNLRTKPKVVNKKPIDQVACYELLIGEICGYTFICDSYKPSVGEQLFNLAKKVVHEL